MYFLFTILLALGLASVEYLYIVNIGAKWGMIIVTFGIAMLRYSLTLERDANECFNGHSLINFYLDHGFKPDSRWFLTIWIPSVLIMLYTEVFTAYSVSFKTGLITIVVLPFMILSASLLATKRMFAE